MNATRPTINGQESGDKSGIIIGVAAAVMTISTAVVGMRILSRSLIKQRGWDDCAAVASLVSMSANLNFLSLNLTITQCCIIGCATTMILSKSEVISVFLQFMLIGNSDYIRFWEARVDAIN